MEKGIKEENKDNKKIGTGREDEKQQVTAKILRLFTQPVLVLKCIHARSTNQLVTLVSVCSPCFT
jgi:hypothetical protein